MNTILKSYILHALLCITLNAKCMDTSISTQATQDYDQIVNDRIEQKLKGKTLLTNVNDDVHFLLTRLAYGNRLDLLQKLLNHDPSIVRRKEFSSAIHTSIFKNNFVTTKWFLQNGVDPNITEKTNTPLHAICDYDRNLIFIKLLLFYNANPNLQDKYGFTPLHNISKDFWLEYLDKPEHALASASTLIIGGADITIKTFNNSGSGSTCNEKTAIEIAQIKATTDIAKYFKHIAKGELAEHIKRIATMRDALFAAVQNGEDLNFSSDERFTEIPFRHVRDIDGNSLLHYAIKYNNEAVTKKLINYWPELYFQPNFNNELPTAIERLNNPPIEPENAE